jgi:hypothetical protein
MRSVVYISTLISIAFLFVIFGGTSKNSFGGQKMKKESVATLDVVSSAFHHEKSIPQKYTCDGEDISPPIRWQGPPFGTKSFILIAEDPDAPVGNWVHWILYNIPDSVLILSEGVPKQEELPDGTRQGMTNFNEIGYGGPCPPSGTHRYYFRVYAVDIMLNLEPSKATRENILKAIEGHTLAFGELMGKYGRH